MNNFKIFTSLFFGILFISNAQTSNTNNKLLTGDIQPEVIARKVGPNTVVYSYKEIPKQNKNQHVNNNANSFSTDNNDNYEYPIMRAKHGVVLPFEFIFNGSASSKAGIAIQEFYFNTLMDKPELNKIIYQDIKTTRERLNNAGIFDAKDMNYFDMPLIAKIVGAGILITAKITVDTKNTKTASKNINNGEYNTETLFQIYDKNGYAVFNRREAPYTATTRDSYQVTLEHLMKQTPYYHQH